MVNESRRALVKKKNDKIIKFHRQIHINIGVIIFGVILIYVIFHVFSFLTSKNITVYEVNEGTIAENQEYQALAIRQEQIVTAPVAGDIFYFTPDISRAGVRTRICSIDTTGEITDELTAGASDVVDTEALDLSRVSSSIGTFSGEYTDMDFQKVYAFKNSLTAEIQQLSSEYLLQQLADQVATASSAGTFHMLYAQTPGLVVYQTDGYESVTADNFTEEDLDPSRVTVTDLKGQESVTEGQAVYKLVTSDHWELIAEIDEETASKYEDGEYVEIRFPEDQSTTWAQCQIQQKEDRYYLKIVMILKRINRILTEAYVDGDDRLVGYAFCILQQQKGSTVMTDVKTLYIDDLCVDEALRGQHIGRTLYDAAVQYAKDHGCYNLTLNVWAGNDSAKRFYESCGLRPLKYGMETIL